MELKKGKFNNTEYEIIISENAIANGFSIGKQTDLEMILTDIFNDQYQADVSLRTDWTASDLQSIIVETILNCHVNVKHLKATFKGAVSAN